LTPTNHRIGKMKISKGIMPPESRGAPRKYPFDEMEVGDSFDIPIEDDKTARGSVYVSATRLGMKASIRAIEDKGIYRVWRVK